MNRVFALLTGLFFYSASFGRPYLMYVSVQPSSSQSYTAEIQVNILQRAASDVLFGQIDLFFGDGEYENIPYNQGEKVLINPEFIQVKFVRKHTYPGLGAYKITARFFNRVADAVNMAHSVNTPLYVEMRFYMDTLLGANCTPELENMPFFHKKGLRYFYELSFADKENDSLSFNLHIPRQDKETEVMDYWYPGVRDMITGRFLNRISIDPAQGALFWNADNSEGIYSVAVNMDEWRKTNEGYQKISSTVIDYVIDIQETENTAPVISGLRDTVLLAGLPFEFNLAADDPDGDSVSVGIYGNFAAMTGTTVREGSEYINPPYLKNITYNPLVDHVRQRPYKLVATAIDKNADNTSLGTVASMHVWVAEREHYPSPPNGLSATSADPSAVIFTWNDSDDELGYIVERENGHFAGYEKIAILPPGITVFYDSGTVAASTYHYRITAVGSKMAVSGTTSVTTPVITALSKSPELHEVRIFPNPSDGNFWLTKMPENGMVRILDLSGRLVWKNDDYFSTTSGAGSLIQTQLTPGVYLLNISGGEQEIIRKLIVR